MRHISTLSSFSSVLIAASLATLLGCGADPAASTPHTATAKKIDCIPASSTDDIRASVSAPRAPTATAPPIERENQATRRDVRDRAVAITTEHIERAKATIILTPRDRAPPLPRWRGGSPRQQVANDLKTGREPLSIEGEGRRGSAG